MEIAVEKYLAEQKYYFSWMSGEDSDSPKCFPLYPEDIERLEAGYLVIDEFYKKASIIYITIDDIGIAREYASLTSMMLTEAECIEKDIPTSAFWMVDESYQIWRKYNISIIDEILANLGRRSINNT